MDDDVAQKISRMEARLDAAERKAESASEIALAAVAAVPRLQAALEAGHSKEGEMLAAMRTMTQLAESLARSVLGGKGGA